jgi:RNA polymerase sigma-70 factor (ECF subfamily)
LDQPTDAELMVRARSGDEDAFARIVDRYKNPLVNYLARLTGNRDDGEEYAQEAFYRLYRDAARFRDGARVSPLLFRIAINLVRTQARKARLWRLLVPKVAAAETGLDESADGGVLQEEIETRVQDAIARLPPKYREAVLLRDIEGWSYDEIAPALGCGMGTLKSRIGRGRALLRRHLEPYWKGGNGHGRP